MKKKPRNAKKSLFADGLWTQIITEGLMLGILTLLAFYIGIVNLVQKWEEQWHCITWNARASTCI